MRATRRCVRGEMGGEAVGYTRSAIEPGTGSCGGGFDDIEELSGGGWGGRLCATAQGGKLRSQSTRRDGSVGEGGLRDGAEVGALGGSAGVRERRCGGDVVVDQFRRSFRNDSWLVPAEPHWTWRGSRSNPNFKKGARGSLVLHDITVGRDEGQEIGKIEHQ